MKLYSVYCMMMYDCIPFSKQLRAVQGLADNACPLGRWVGPGGPDDLLHLGQDAGQVLVVLGNHGQVTHPLIWEEDGGKDGEEMRGRSLVSE